MLLENNPYPQDTRVRREAEALVAAGHQVEVVAPRHEGQAARERLNGVEIRRFRAFHWEGRGAVALFLEYLFAIVGLHAAAVRALARGTTVLHINNPPDILFLAGAMFRLAGRRVIYDHHDFAPELAAIKFRSRWPWRMALVGERLTFAVANHVIAVNDSHAEIALQRGRKSRDDITVVRNGPPAAWTRCTMGIRGGPLRSVHLGYVGAIAKQDGLGGIAPILAYLCHREPAIDAFLTVVGDGDEREAVEALFAQWGVQARVRLTGWVSAEQLPAIFEDVDVCVEPAPSNSFNEITTMTKVAEYLALGKPVVAYDLREIRRTARDAAILVAPNDEREFAEAIAALASDPRLRRTLADRARKRASELTWERSVPALLDVYARSHHAKLASG